MGAVGRGRCRGACAPAAAAGRERGRAGAMLWFGGSIPAAIAAAKQRSAVFVVVVSGTGGAAAGSRGTGGALPGPALPRRPARRVVLCQGRALRPRCPASAP